MSLKEIVACYKFRVIPSPEERRSLKRLPEEILADNIQTNLTLAYPKSPLEREIRLDLCELYLLNSQLFPHCFNEYQKYMSKFKNDEVSKKGAGFDGSIH